MSTPDQTTHRPFAANARGDAVPAWSPADEPTRHGLLERGRNCDAIRHADGFTTLVDGAAYFPTLRAALRRARHTVFILGWDVDSRMQLAPDSADDGLPDTLAPFLHTLATARHNLRIYMLAWDFAMIYALERDWPPVYRAAWRAHRGIRFRLDDPHGPDVTVVAPRVQSGWLEEATMGVLRASARRDRHARGRRPDHRHAGAP